ncbi:MAG: alanine racemase, partial [Deltaproteobacteria bacterium]|nr:alanine racemase [Deltaproteobacteria bacterium]
QKKAAPGAKVMAIVKANAYGHGDIETARVFESLGCLYFGVAIPEEGARLRHAGIKASIVVLGGVFPGQIKDMFDLDLTPVVFDLKTASLIAAHASKAGIVKKLHLKIDTGMGRLGATPDEAAPLARRIHEMGGLRIEGVMSHFSESESEVSAFTEEQLRAFNGALGAIKSATGADPELIHMANSAAVVSHPESRFNLVRPGIMLYGSYPAPHLTDKIRLKPAMRIITKVLHVRNAPKGSPISYGRRFVASRDSIIAVLPIGYGDGYPRCLTGKADALIRGRRAPVAGAVCMDLIMCDVTGIPGVEAGDEAVILGPQEGTAVTAEELAGKAGTIPYEIFCGISGRVPRIYV